MNEREIGRRIPTQADFDLFAEISGDDNPIHVDPGFSTQTRFGRTVSHGMLLYSWAWALLIDIFPGSDQDKAQLMFPNPCYAGEEIAFFLNDGEPDLVKVTIRRTADQAEVLLLETVLKDESR